MQKRKITVLALSNLTSLLNALPLAAADETPKQPAPAVEPAKTAETKEPSFVRREGDEFTIRVSYNKEPGYRDIGIDVDTLALVKLQNGEEVIAATVAYISNFDLLPDGEELKKVVAMTEADRQKYLDALTPQARDMFESMLRLPAAQQQMILTASRNKTIDQAQVAFMLQHVVTAHGITYDDVKNAAEYAKNFWGKECKLTPEQIQKLNIKPVEDEKKSTAAKTEDARKAPESTNNPQPTPAP